MPQPTAKTDSPTGQDLFKLAIQLQRAYAQRLGIDQRVPVKALLDTSIDVSKFDLGLATLGYEMYTDCVGHLVIRTKEAGDAHRALVQAEKDLDYAERNPQLVPYAKLPSLRR